MSSEMCYIYLLLRALSGSRAVQCAHVGGDRGRLPIRQGVERDRHSREPLHPHQIELAGAQRTAPSRA